MSKPLRIFCLDFSEIPAIDKVVALVTSEQHLVLQFPRLAERFDPDAIIDDLFQRLKDCTVFYSGAAHETENISIVRAIQEQVVLEVDMRLRDYKNRQAIPDPYFFAQYVRTTKSETNISNLIRHKYHDMARALNVLSKAGYLPLEN